MMEICKLSDIAKFTTGKLNSNAAETGGNYPFFTCAPEPLRINTYAFDTEAIILAGNNAEGNFHIQYYEGKFNAYQRTYVIESCEASRVNLRYLYYALKMCLHHFKQISQGTATKFLTAKILNGCELPIPTIELQNKIASLLGDLDEKIEANKIINKNLYEQMLSIFNNARRTSAWNKHKLGDVLIFFDNLRKPLSSIQREKMEHIYPYYGAASIVDYVEDYLFDGTYILISEDGANVIDSFGHPLTQYTYGKFWVNNHAHIVKGSNGYSEALVYAMLGTLNMQSIVTGAAQPKINQANLRNFEAVLPESEEAQVLSELLNPVLQQMLHHDQENEKLSELRDILLPQLMSGALDVSAIDL